ncbi:hypothetical protein HDR63_02480 [bacterium]|nr:hypothetical protein [bacterium]
MALKPRYKRRILWTALCMVAAAALAAVIIPPRITLNKLRPELTSVLAMRTGADIQIQGPIRFSLMGGPTIAAHDIVVPNGRIDTVQVSIPWAGVFHLDRAPLSGPIRVTGARITIDRLTPIPMRFGLDLRDCVVTFLGKDYEIIRATLDGGALRGLVRTDQHKYDIDFTGDAFTVKNQANDLTITGNLYADGAARGTAAIKTDNINRWFQFDQPKIDGPVALTLDFEWDGAYGFDFTNIRGDNFTGRIQLMENGDRVIQLKARDVDMDLSFITGSTGLLKNTTYDLDLRGRMTFLGHTLDHLVLRVAGDDNEIKIDEISTDTWRATGGHVHADGARDVRLSGPWRGAATSCLFSGTPTDWTCREFSHGDMTGHLRVTDDTFDVTVRAARPMPDTDQLIELTRALGQTGQITFDFTDAAGRMDVTHRGAADPTYTFAQGRTPHAMRPDLFFIPAARMDDPGDWTGTGDAMTYTATDGTWRMQITANTFDIQGNNIKDWLGIDHLQFLRDLPFTARGDFARGRISNLVLTMGNTTFTGTMAGDTLTLRTDMLNTDAFASQEFLDRYDELQFRVPSPITAPFDLDIHLSLAADTLIYNGNAYRNFVYALKSGIQTFSIADNDRGNILAQIRQNKKKYDISVQLNRFVITAPLLNADAPLNVRDAQITGTIDMQTNGYIAYDVTHNLTGTVDLGIDGGTLIGLGLDAFYAAAPNITKLNAEMALAAALESGTSAIKTMHITGRFGENTFETTAPMSIRLRHMDGTGMLAIRDGVMTAQLDLMLRATAPTPAPVRMRIMGAARDYALSDIMMNFDPDFMREFVRTHDRF